MRVVYPSSPASYFHLLRWQGRDHVEKPLVVLTPEEPAAPSRAACRRSQELAEGHFQPVIDDPAAHPAAVRRVVLVSGKLYYDLLQAREKAGRRTSPSCGVEQLYPFPAAELAVVLARYPQAELVWAQEEPRNMGAWRFVRERFLDGEVADPARPAARATWAARTRPHPPPARTRCTWPSRRRSCARLSGRRAPPQNNSSPHSIRNGQRARELKHSPRGRSAQYR